jgi:DNA polymerase/3'-5' exonuclease PolX
MKVDEAYLLANRVMEYLRPACSKIEIAGSIRRRKPEVKDIELVAVPLFGTATDLLGELLPNSPTKLDDLIDQLVFAAKLDFDHDVKRNGAKYKKLVVDGPSGSISIDLFIAQEENFGNILAIRTGSWEFSKWFMTKRPYGGMPQHLRQFEGFLWDDERRLSCPTEEAFFAALHLPILNPKERNAAGVEKLSRDI